jgi:ABC-type long-subunit fatty acid transport system fused permease/ATPase subunit
MKPSDVKSYYKSGYNFRKQTKMSDNSLHNWVKWGYVPFAAQKKIEELTGGKLAAVWNEKE